MSSAAHRRTQENPEETAGALLEIVNALIRDTRARAPGAEPITLDSRLERDLGLDSLSRTELLHRIEQRFGGGLPDEALSAETPRDLLRMVLSASGLAPAESVAGMRYDAPAATRATPSDAETLLQVLDWHAQANPDRAYLHLYEDSDQTQDISYRQLQQRARAVASGLREKGLQPGQAVAIMLPTGSDYFFSFFGILYAGGVPVPIYPPVRPSQIEEHLRRHSRILSNANATILITVRQAKAVARLLQAQVQSLRHVLTVADLGGAVGRWISPPIHAGDTAFVQYTSGSTGDPKGVVLTHANLLASLRAMGARVQAQSTDVFVSWLPLYHDMGLIGACFGSLYYGFPLAVMSPLSFLAKPARWLWAIHRHRGTLSAAPNFAYELCLRNIDERDIEGLDLSSWRLACNGAEPVSVETMERFSRRFAPYGFHAEAMAPVYGLAECSLAVTLHAPGRGLIVDRIGREVFMRSGRALPAAEDDPNLLRFASCGQPIPGHQVRIVDDSGRELPEREEGRLEFKGPAATGGYLNNPEATRKLFHADWLESGDRAYIAEGEVYLTGRVKDLIVRGGRNLYPYELEDAVGELQGIRKGCVAVVASSAVDSGTERLVVIAETREKDPNLLESLRRQVLDTCIDLLGMPPDEVVLAPPHAVLKTSSGKIRRAAVRELYERKALGQGTRAVWWQLARLAATSALPQLRKLRRRMVDNAYAAYAWTVFGLVTPLVWLAVATLPRLSWRWRFLRGSGRLLGGLTGISLTVEGLENLPRTGSFVLVANHSSYLDSLVLTVAVPRDLSYVAKQELREHFLVRVVLERLDIVFVERFDIQRSADAATGLINAVRAGRSLVFFPEGTFDRMPGLLSFRMGGFTVAAQAGVPVVPVTIRGTRSLLRAGSWFPRRGSLQVLIGKPIEPEGEDWQAAVTLRDAARKVILQHCGEPDLEDERAAVFAERQE